ncbi:acyl-CoA thioesterase [Tellurirhabdus rosea]|uniref:acyl-CoA thioesterase n=1 Tax=Tellurirhabdus rosea TaxID=2674997 RepID=UPI00225064BD|nr:thioesterase family protein [Tellurirhabdus rosea]
MPSSFSHSLRVRWSEVDAYGVVFNGNYLNYFDVAITEYFRNLGLQFTNPEAIGGEFYVRKATLEYHGPARFDDLLDIQVRCGRIGNSSLQLLLLITRNGELLVSGEIIYVNTDPATRTAAPVSPSLRQRIEAFENPSD